MATFRCCCLCYYCCCCCCCYCCSCCCFRYTCAWPAPRCPRCTSPRSARGPGRQSCRSQRKSYRRTEKTKRKKKKDGRKRKGGAGGCWQPGIKIKFPTFTRIGQTTTITVLRPEFRQFQNFYKSVPSPTGNRTPVSSVTGGDTHHYTIEEVLFWLTCNLVG